MRGHYPATFQYAFTIPGVVAPAVVGLFAAGIWIPWLVVAITAWVAISVCAGSRRGVNEMTWAPDSRATWQYGKEIRPGEPHIIWRRVGTHAIFTPGPS